MIGPNAILQMLPAIADRVGTQRLAGLVAEARLPALPDGQSMIPETDAAALHRQVRRALPTLAEAISADAGRRTADYILAHRIPRPVQAALKRLPAALAAPILSRAIARHAWTFAGSGRFRTVDAWTFELRHNPLIRAERATAPLCAWHAAVFERLYATLVHPACRCRETSCGAMAGSDELCRFEVRR